MAKQRVEIELDVPEGWEATGEFRDPAEGDAFISSSGELVPFCSGGYSNSPRLILRRVEPVRESRWLNIHNKDSVGYMRSDKSECDFHEHPKGRAGLIRLEFSGDDLVGVSIENARPVTASIEEA